MFLPVTTLTAATLAALLIALSARVIGERQRLGQALGFGTDAAFLARIRAHANFTEYAPFCLVLIALGEAQGAPWWLAALPAACLVAGRVLHPVALDRGAIPLRVRAMVLTFAAIALAALIALGTLVV